MTSVPSIWDDAQWFLDREDPGMSKEDVRKKYELYVKATDCVMPFEDVWKGYVRSRRLKCYRKNIYALEDKMLETSPEGYGNNGFNPLKHFFGDDLYVREIFMPAGQLIMSRLHKFTHPYFIMKGEVSVLTENGPIHVTAPYWGMTQSGTKRVLYAHKDTVWITVHSAEKKDTDILEEELTAVNFDHVMVEDDANVKAFVELIQEEELKCQ